MMRRIFWPLAAAATFASGPVAAQESGALDPAAVLAQAFPVEPLTAEQQGRIPQAQAIVDKMIPPGSMKNIMGPLFDGLFDPLLAATTEPTTADAAQLLGLDAELLDLGNAQAAEIVAIVDPAYGERAVRTAKVLPEALNGLMAAAEPGMRKAMTEAYAIHFDDRELADINAFFDTPSGAAYARKSIAMSGDSRYVSAMMQAMPNATTGMSQVEAAMAAAVADLPEAKGYGDLTAAERKRLVELTGLDADTIQVSMELAAHEEDAALEREEE